jgi:hypothetical protein
MVTIKKVDDQYIMDVDGTETVLEVKQPKGWDETLFLPENPTGRKLINRAACDKRLEANGGSFELTVKTAHATGPRGKTIPNAKLVEYLKTLDNGQELYDEYMAIIDEAYKAMDAAKAKPLTEREKLELKIKKAQEALAKLEAAAADTDKEVKA